MISGIASGTSTFHSACQPVMPMPRAASRIVSSIERIPTSVLSRIGGTAIATSATITGQTDSGCRRKTSVTTPSVGSARQKFDSVAANSEPRPVWPISRPIGSAISAAMPTPSSEYQMCSSSRAKMPSEPDQCEAFVSQLIVSRHRARPRPGGEEAPAADDQQVERRARARP